MTEQNKEKALQERMAELLSKEYGLSEEQYNKLKETDVADQEEVAKKFAEENKVDQDKEKHDDINRGFRNLNKHRIV